jgi:hypothetical protein
MSASEVQICNLALLKFGDLSISALTDETKEARACRILYPLMRDELLYCHPWNFAMKRADISAALTTAPAFPEDWYAYTLPVDCLRVWEFYGSDEEWTVEGGLFLTPQDEEIYIRYIWGVTETGRFNPAFVSCLATRLGAELANKLMGDAGKTIRTELLSELENILLPNARVLNAMEGNPPRHKNIQPLDEGNFSWQSEGR